MLDTVLLQLLYIANGRAMSHPLSPTEFSRGISKARFSPAPFPLGVVPARPVFAESTVTAPLGGGLCPIDVIPSSTELQGGPE